MGRSDQGAFLSFEQDDGSLAPVFAQDVARRIRGTTFLVTLNACVSATPGPTEFSNLAAALVRQGIPYVLGMRFSIPDTDAKLFTRAFYSDLARGVPIEEALLQARLVLAKSSYPWMVGVTVLYTALSTPAAGFARGEGTPQIIDPADRTQLELSPLPRAEGGFQGRIEELRTLGTVLTADRRPPIITIHGTGGQGKTTLAREVVDRFAWAWPGGVWATSLENLPNRDQFVHALARFLMIDSERESENLERQLLARLRLRRTLIVLDNAETLVEAVEAHQTDAIELAQWIFEYLPTDTVSLLITSRRLLEKPDECILELNGLTPEEGRRLFRACAPRRRIEANDPQVHELSRQLHGHPLSLRLLGSAFDASEVNIAEFIAQYKANLIEAQNKYRDKDHRHHSLYASIETSVRYLDNDLRGLLSGLWVFHAPFLADVAATILDTNNYPENEQSPVPNQLHTLWQRGLLVRELTMLRDSSLQLYRVLPIVRLYAEQFLTQRQSRDELLARFGAAYNELVAQIYRRMDNHVRFVAIAQQAREDFERGLAYADPEYYVQYAVIWGQIMERLGDRKHALVLAEGAIEATEGGDPHLRFLAINNTAGVYAAIGQPQRALALYEQTLPLSRAVGDRGGEADTLSNMANVYKSIGQPQRALALYEEALPIQREVGNWSGTAITLNDMAGVYRITGQPQPALALFEQALLISREVGNRPAEATSLNNIAEMYGIIGQPQRALALFEQALPILREVNDRSGEAATLNNMAAVYRSIGQVEQALAFYEQALPIRREVGDRGGEADTLNNLATVYHSLGQLERALALFEQALLISREVGDRRGEATTLSNMAGVYKSIGQPQRALALLEETLSTDRAIGDRAGEAATLNNMANAYAEIGQLQRALSLYEQALPMQRQVGDRHGEATILSSMAGVYRATGELQRALALLEQAIPIRREVGNREGEIATLNSLAYVYMDLALFLEAHQAFKQSINLSQQINYPAAEISGLIGTAFLLYNHMEQPGVAIACLEKALGIFAQTGLPQDEAGMTPTRVQVLLDMMRTGQPLHTPSAGPATLPNNLVQAIVQNTIAALTNMPERRAEWHDTIAQELANVRQQNGRQRIAEFLSAILAFLDGQVPRLPDDHPYATAIMTIRQNIRSNEPRQNSKKKLLKLWTTIRGVLHRSSGIVDYRANDHLELVKSLELATQEPQIAANDASHGTESISYLETWTIGIHTARWLRASTAKGTSEEEIRTAIHLLKELAARRGLLDILGKIDEIAAALSEDDDLNKALRGCVSLCGQVADRFEHQGKADHEQLVTVAGNLELWMFYVSFGVRAQGLPRSGIDITRYRALPLPEGLRQLLSAYFREAAAHIESAQGSREDLLRKGQDVEARIASHLRSLPTSAIA